MTRLYTRLSPGEMTSDPSCRRTAGGDVDRTRQLERYVDGRDLCEWEGTGPIVDPTTPCDFASCGIGGLCREATGATADVTIAGCACVPGTTARTTFDPAGRPTVSCVDRRLSFLNPGDREGPGEEPLGDPCVGFACGAGTCVAMNMTPTCICDEGSIAVGSLSEDGTRLTDCVSPTTPVPDEFYNWRLPNLPVELPGGREVVVPPPSERTLGGGGCSSTGPVAPSSLALLAIFGILAIRRRK